MNLEELKTKKDNYVQQEAVKIISDMLKRERTEWSVSTCNHYNWDTKLHEHFPSIAENLRSKGFSVRSSVKFGVTDWYISI